MGFGSVNEIWFEGEIYVFIGVFEDFGRANAQREGAWAGTTRKRPMTKLVFYLTSDSFIIKKGMFPGVRSQLRV